MLLRRLLPSLGAFTLAIALAAPAAAAPAGVAAPGSRAHADHLGGTFVACGILAAYTPPVLGTPGELTIGGSVEFADHVYPISDAATVDPLLAGLAAAAEWTCLELVGDGMGVITDITVPTGATLCGSVEDVGGTLGHRQEFTTLLLDGAAGALVAGDADLSAILEALAALAVTPGVACLDVTLDAGGSLSALAIDYAAAPASDETAPIACGTVDGTPIAYRDPASQPYPEGLVVAVDGFAVDASLVAAPHQSVLSFHLDAGLEPCLLARVVDTVIVEAAVLTGPDARVCGELEVIGGLVFVDAVVVSQGLTAVNFAEPSGTSIDLACADARADEDFASGSLDVCASLGAVGATTYEIDGITLHLETPVDVDPALTTGGPQGIGLAGPDPFQPFGVANPATLTSVALDGCTEPDEPAEPASPAPIPDTRLPADSYRGSSQLGGLLGLLGLATLITLRLAGRRLAAQ